jgi:hypothetical protein
MVKILTCSDIALWRGWLDHYERIDVCHMPEYHQAYETRLTGGKALLWNYTSQGDYFSYPFMLAPVTLKFGNDTRPTGLYDISGVYGFSGPLASTDNRDFLNEAWARFDQWAHEQKVISEFIRFSVFARNSIYAHPKCELQQNRPISISNVNTDTDKYFETLPSKTRNMIRRAQKEGFVAREVEIKKHLSTFRTLYEETMDRNSAPGFFAYDDDYYRKLLSLPPNEIGLHAVFKEDKMVAAAIVLLQKQFAFYHLGASELASSRLGAGNLMLFEMITASAGKGVTFFNVGGGRSTAADDALFTFKKNNGNAVDIFYIGKRVLQQDIYEDLAHQWMRGNSLNTLPSQLQFYR